MDRYLFSLYKGYLIKKWKICTLQNHPYFAFVLYPFNQIPLSLSTSSFSPNFVNYVVGKIAHISQKKIKANIF